MSYSLLCPQGLEWCLAPSEHGGVVSAATEVGGSLKDSFMLTLYLEGVERKGRGQIGMSELLLGAYGRLKEREVLRVGEYKA